MGRLRGYAIADAYARFRRARADDVLFSVALDSFGTNPKPGDGEDVLAWIEARCAALREQLDRLELSLDWERAGRTHERDLYRWSQWLFVKLVDAGLAYRNAGGGWALHVGASCAENDSRLDELEGWSERARATQRELLRRIDGAEVEAQALDGTPLTLFAAHPDAIASAELVALSPQRPELDRWLDDESVRRQVAEQRERDWTGVQPAQRPAIDIGLSAQVPGVAQPLPILVSASVDARFGPAAIVGVPSVDEADKALARDLPKLGGLAWKTDAKPPKTTPATRYRLPDMPLSRGRAWGAPVPVVHCDACGAVPLSVDQLPLDPPPGLDVTARGAALEAHDEWVSCECPRCGAQARRDTGTIHPRLGAAWLELALAVPAGERPSTMFDHPDLRRWLPTTRTVEDDAASTSLLDARTIAKALRDAGVLDFLEDGEPHGPTMIHAPLEVPDATPDVLIDRYGPDALRFALLHAAVPTKRVSMREPAVRAAADFLERLHAHAESRLDGAAPDARIDAGDGLRRRLARWCDTAVERVGENYERLDLHRATRNAIRLLDRIEDFERRAVGYRGELAGSDREAVAIALAVLLRLLAPIAPAVTSDLWKRTGSAQPIDEVPWPQLQREPAAA